jgi:hypothetical protein
MAGLVGYILAKVEDNLKDKMAEPAILKMYMVARNTLLAIGVHVEMMMFLLREIGSL